MGTARNLAAEEILEQAARAAVLLRAEGRRLRNVVFMGMGEPMHNLDAVTEAVARLVDPRWFALSPRHVVVSTAGVLGELRRFAVRFPEVSIALSLHAARDEVRARLVPLAARTPLAETREALRAIEAVRGRPVLLEYLLLDGVNDGADDVDALVAYCRGLRVHVNLMPYNPIAAAPELRRTPPARQHAFAAALKRAGLRVTTRRSLGGDVDGAR
jgi:23S rRNA (adenine2503-C2)-methyltransferase